MRTSASPTVSRGWLWGLAAVLAVNALARLPYLHWSVVQGDESVYACSAARMCAIGGLPMATVAENRGPVAHWFYQLAFALFGPYNMPALRILAIGWVSAGILLLYRLLAPRFGPAAALAGCAAFASAGASHWWLQAVNVEVVATPIVLASLLLAARGLETGSPRPLAAAGALAGIAALTKLPFLMAAGAAGLALGWKLLRKEETLSSLARKGLWLSAGFALPVAAVAALYALAGELSTLRFYYWDVNVYTFKGGFAPGLQIWDLLRTAIDCVAAIPSTPLLLYAAGLVLLAFELLSGAVRLARGKKDGKGAADPAVPLMTSYCLLSYGAVHSREGLTLNYLSYLLPAFGWLTARLVRWILDRPRIGALPAPLRAGGILAFPAACVFLLACDLSNQAAYFGRKGLRFHEWRARWMGEGAEPLGGEYGRVCDHLRKRLRPGDPVFAWTTDAAPLVELKAFPASRFAYSNYLSLKMMRQYPPEVLSRLESQLLEDLRRFPPRFILLDLQIVRALPGYLAGPDHPFVQTFLSGYRLEGEVGGWLVYAPAGG